MEKSSPRPVEAQKPTNRNPGPKPQSVEAARLMIVDAVGATLGTVEEPTRQKIAAMIRYIIENWISDGQFDDAISRPVK
jgi:cyclic-di-AMP phosphodiesterase PgpH